MTLADLARYLRAISTFADVTSGYLLDLDKHIREEIDR